MRKTAKLNPVSSREKARGVKDEKRRVSADDDRSLLRGRRHHRGIP